MNEAIIILMNMRGGCATVGDKVHTLFRLNSRSRKVAPQASAGEAQVSFGKATANADDEVQLSR